MSLHYLVKLEMLIERGLPLRCYRKNQSHLNCGPQMRQIWIDCLQRESSPATESVQNMHYWWTNSNLQRLSSLQQPLGISRSVMRVFYTFSCNISHIFYWLECGEFGGHSWNGINSGVSFCNNSMVVCVRWTFQVSQGSVETLFRWVGKRLHRFAANLFRKRCTKFHQNCRSSIGNITKKHFGDFFLDTL